MKPSRSIQFKPQHIIALIAIFAAGVIAWQAAGWLAGVAAAIAVLAVNEVIERRARNR